METADGNKSLGRFTALVSGSTRGIGFEIASRLLERGATVILNGRHLECSVLDDLRSRNVPIQRAHYLAGDFSILSEVVAIRDKALSLAPAVQVLINNAGEILDGEDIYSESELVTERLIRVNLLSAVNAVKVFVPDMKAMKWGRIVNMSSIYGYCPAGPVATYGAAKAALISLTRSLALDLAPSGITVNAILPGTIDTAMTAAAGDSYVGSVVARTPVRRLGRPEEVAHACDYLIDAGFVTGSELVVDGGLSLVGG